MNASRSKPVIQVNFTARRYEALGGGLFKRADSFYERPQIDGKRTIRKLKARTEKAARLELGQKRSKQAMAEFGHAQDPYKRTNILAVADIAKFYVESGCPKRNRQPREGKQLKDELKRVEHIVEYFGRMPWNTITVEECAAYHVARTRSLKRKNSQGDRTVDLELNALSAIFRWAVRHDKRTGVKTNPIIHDRPRFRDPEKVRHCRDVQPASGDELHQLAAWFFARPKSAVFGWQLLFEAMIGHRTNEILRLRWDAAKGEPGHIAYEKRRGKLVPTILYLYRSTGHKGAYGHIDIHPALADAIEALKEWHQRYFPTSPWFFPGRGTGAEVVSKDALTRALKAACEDLKLPPRTSHGFRSFYCNVLRSDRDAAGNPKLSDAEIGLRMGHKSGSRMVVSTYGEISPERFSWLPSEGKDPAWKQFAGTRAVQMELAL